MAFATSSIADRPLIPRNLGEFWKELGKDVRGGLFFLFFPLLLLAMSLYGTWSLLARGEGNFKGSSGSFMLGILGMLCYAPGVLILSGEKAMPGMLIALPIYFFSSLIFREILFFAEDQARHEEEMERGSP